MSLWLNTRLISSTNMLGSNKRDTFGRSFTYARNRSGPRMDTWVTPQVIYLRSVLLFSIIWKNWSRPDLWRQNQLSTDFTDYSGASIGDFKQVIEQVIAIDWIGYIYWRNS